MNDRIYQMSRSINEIYDEVGDEIGFDVPLPVLMENHATWKANVAESLRRANAHLLSAERFFLPQDEKTNQLLLGELIIRDLVERLKDELDGFISHTCGIERTTVPDVVRNGRHENSVGAPGAESDRPGALIYPFSRQGSQIEVTVDHVSETNFFADIYFDLHGAGLFVATYDILNVGKELDVRLVLPGRNLFKLTGTVSWIREPDNCAEGVSPGMGLVFKTLRQEHKMAIQQFMSERSPLLYDVA